MLSLGLYASEFNYRIFRTIFNVLKRCSELQLNWFLAPGRGPVMKLNIVCRHFGSHRGTTADSGDLIET